MTETVTELHCFGFSGSACFQDSASPQAKPPQLIFLSMKELVHTVYKEYVWSVEHISYSVSAGPLGLKSESILCKCKIMRHIIWGDMPLYRDAEGSM